MRGCPITAYPIRIIPFDLGRSLHQEDITALDNRLLSGLRHLELTPRQSSILKGVSLTFSINDHLSAYLYANGICVVVVEERKICFQNDFERFSIPYGQNRKKAHNDFFKWNHEDSSDIWDIIYGMRKIVRERTKRKSALRKSGSEEFENRGLSYVMTLSMFDVDKNIICGTRFNHYPDWLKSNIYALLDPAALYLEDSNKFDAAGESEMDLRKILSELEIDENLKDYERHRHIDTYMSWAAVATFGQLQGVDKEEYTALEVQLQSDWFYVYCLDKNLDDLRKPSKRDMVDIQRQHYEIDLLENRLYDFDDSSMPTRILDIQKGLVQTSGLAGNIEHLQRKIQYVLEREQLNGELRQKRLGRSTEILLYLIAFIEIAPTVAEYGELVFPHAGLIANCLLIVLGLALVIRKN